MSPFPEIPCTCVLLEFGAKIILNTPLVDGRVFRQQTAFSSQRSPEYLAILQFSV